MFPTDSNKSRRWTLPLLAVWLTAVSVPLALKMGQHHAGLPGPDAFRIPDATNAWEAVHVLSADCGCSGVVADYLGGRKPQAGLAETVILVGGSAEWESRLKAVGFSVVHRTEDELLAETGVEGVPWLILRQAGQPASYSGGYSKTPPRPGGEFADLRILAALRSGAGPGPALPAYGCATSQRLRKLTDPVGFNLSQLGQPPIPQ